MRPRLDVIPENFVERVVEEALDVLRTVGVFVENEEALSVLGDSGAEVDLKKRRVKIPENLVENALDTVPSSFRLYDRDGNEAVHVGGSCVTFVPGSAALKLYDPSIGGEREPDSRDCVRFVRVVEE